MRINNLPSFSNPHITFFRDYLFLVTLSEIFYFFLSVGICVCSLFFFFLHNNCHIKARTYISWFLLLFSRESYPTLLPHGLQHTRPPCPSPSPEVCPSSPPLHWWCHPAISFSDTLFFCPHSFPASGTFPMSRLFVPDDQNTRASASGSVLPTSIQGWFLLRLTGLISLLSKGLSGVFSSTTVRRHQFFGILLFFTVQLSKPYVTTGKNLALIIQTFVSRVMSLLFNTLFRFVIVFLPRSNCLLVS